MSATEPLYARKVPRIGTSEDERATQGLDNIVAQALESGRASTVGGDGHDFGGARRPVTRPRARVAGRNGERFFWWSSPPPAFASVRPKPELRCRALSGFFHLIPNRRE